MKKGDESERAHKLYARTQGFESMRKNSCFRIKKKVCPVIYVGVSARESTEHSRLSYAKHSLNTQEDSSILGKFSL